MKDAKGRRERRRKYEVAEAGIRDLSVPNYVTSDLYTRSTIIVRQLRKDTKGCNRAHAGIKGTRRSLVSSVAKLTRGESMIMIRNFFWIRIPVHGSINLYQESTRVRHSR